GFLRVDLGAYLVGGSSGLVAVVLVDVAVLVLVGVGAHVGGDLPAGPEPGLGRLGVGSELADLVIVGKLVGLAVGGLRPGCPIPVVGDRHGLAGAGFVSPRG